jgi:phosphohistidine phosphatase
MARQIWLLRHAEAEPHGTRTDAQRKLTERGEQQAAAAGAALCELAGGFERVLTSSKVRAAETARIALASLDGAQAEEFAPLVDGLDAQGVIEQARALGADGRLLLVGHEPQLSTLVAELTGAHADLKKGGIAAVRLDGGRGELAVLLRPREVFAIAGLQLDGH